MRSRLSRVLLAPLHAELAALTRELKNLAYKINSLERSVDAGAGLLVRSVSPLDCDALAKHEFRVSSQWGDDGIIRYLTDVVDIPNRVFIEFGVGDYTEANTRFLLQSGGWRGLVLDCSKEEMQQPLPE